MPPLPPPPVAEAALRVREAMLRAADAVLPPFAATWQRSMGLAGLHVMHALVACGVVEALGRGPRRPADLADELSLDRAALERVLLAARGMRLVRRAARRGRVALTRTGRMLLADDPASLAPWVRYQASPATQAAWAALPEVVRTGRPGFELAHDTSVWDHFAAHPDEDATFAAAMRGLTAFEADAIAAAPLWPDAGVLCDVAGGTGTLLRAILRRRPALRGVLLEAPGVLAQVDDDLGGRIALREGDLRAPLEVDADAFALKNVLHDWSDETCVELLGRVRDAMGRGARMLVVEQLKPADRPHPFATLTDLQMLTQCEGRERSADELRALLRAAGLTPGRLHRTVADAVLEARI